MRKLLLLALLLFTSTIFAQNVGIGTNKPDESAILDLKSTSKGFLLPRLSEKQKNLIPQPAEGLMIYQTDSNKGLYLYQVGKWRKIDISNVNTTITTNSSANIVTYTPNYLVTADGNGNLSSSGLYLDPTFGNIGLGTTDVSTTKLSLSGNIGGATTVTGILSNGMVQQDVTSNLYNFVSLPRTKASNFVLNALSHFYVQQGPIGTGSSINLQFGFRVNSNLTGAVYNYGFYGEIPKGLNRWNLYMIGDAPNYLSGSLGIGTTSLEGVALNIGKDYTGSPIATGIQASGKILSDVTSQVYNFISFPSTLAANFTLNNLSHFYVQQGTLGVGSKILNQYGFRVNQTLIGANNNYGFYGELDKGKNIYNLYMAGNADNYLSGALGIGTSNLDGANLFISKNISGSTVSSGILSNGKIMRDVTSNVYNYLSIPSTEAASFNLSNLSHFYVQQGSVGSGSTITNQYGYRVASNMVGAINNYGFFSELDQGANIWNLYIPGTAKNYFAGNLGLGVKSATEKLEVSGSIKQSAVTSSLLKADATGKLIAATSGSDFVAAGTNSVGTIAKFSATGTVANSAITEAAITNGSGVKLDSKSAGYLAIGDFGAQTPMSIPAGYRLVVQDGIITEKVKVAIRNQTDWADYVFEPNYSLMPLNEVEDYIRANKHLPNVPSADQMVNKGVEIGETSKMFMEKIEELTLYMIELKKEIENLKAENAKLKK